MNTSNLLNIISVLLLGTITTQIIGWLWYSVIFSGIYVKAANLNLNQIPSDISNSLLIELFARFIRCFFFIFFYNSFGVKDLTVGYQLSLYLVMGFIVPHVLSRVAWEQKSWDYFIIQVSEQCASLLALATWAYLIL